MEQFRRQTVGNERRKKRKVTVEPGKSMTNVPSGDDATSSISMTPENSAIHPPPHCNDNPPARPPSSSINPSARPPPPLPPFPIVFASE